MKILFVCQCNICRSPMAEFIFKHMTEEILHLEIASAGISEERIGCDVHPEAKACLTKHEIPFQDRAAVLFEIRDYFYYDLIVCMDEWDKHSVQIHCFGDPCHKVYKLLALTKDKKDEMDEQETMLNTEIFDPHQDNNFERTFADIYEGCIGLKEYILNKSDVQE